MIRKLHDVVHGRNRDIREQLFRVILVVGAVVTVVAIFAGLMLETAIENTVPLLVLLAVIAVAGVATFRYHKTEFAATFFALIIIGLIFPLVFFIGGGVMSGATVWFVLGILYLFLMFRGAKLLVFLGLAVCVDALSYILAYLHPELVTDLASRSEVYGDSLFAVLTVGIAVGVIMRYQILLYEHERKLSDAQKEKIEEIGRSKDAFFTNMSHEIRTPINTIIGLNEMILREKASEEIAEDAMNIRSASKMLLTLVNDILDFSQIQSDHMEIVPVEYRTKDLFLDVIDLIHVRMQEQELDFFVDIDVDLPSVLLGDEKRIKQILINILTNAAKYTKKGSVTLEVHGEILDAAWENLTISVADTGIGIKKEDLASLYDSFQRVDMEKNRRIEGSGLGLAITKQLVSLMGGTINVDSIYTKGSTFTVTLQQKIVDFMPMGPIDYAEHLKSQEGEYYKQSFEAPEARILIVDDNEANLVVAEKLLRSTKVQIDTAKSGPECLEWTKKKMYHCILLDCMMPGMDGVETLRAIRRQENGLCRRSPIIALTANASAADEQRYIDDGFDGYLAKPVEGMQLEAEILKFLPEDILEYRRNVEEHRRSAAAAKAILHRKRKKILIAADCVCDLPQELVEKYDIRIMYLYIETVSGCFRDTKEIDADNLSRYLASGRGQAHAVSAPVEEYEAFYAEALMEAEKVIFISLAAHAGVSYGHAVAAASGFDNVHVIDSGHISCGEGLLALIAANMVQHGCNVGEICAGLERSKKYIESGFLLTDANTFYRTGYTKKFVAQFCRWFGLHPELIMRQSSLKIGDFRIGRIENARRRFVRRSLNRKDRIDDRVVFFSYAGCSVREQQMMTEEIGRCVPFKKSFVQKACVSNASNSGLGVVGIAYLIKNRGVCFDYDWQEE